MSENVVHYESAGAMVSVDQVKAQVAMIQGLMSSLMKNGEHYGKIPGCGEKPSLLKPGAEKISFMFRLAPDYQIERIDMPGGHREYIITCSLRHVETGMKYGEGVGSCSTMESKYRYRGGEKEGTGQPVPTEYWNFKKDGRTDDAQALIGGRGYAPGKIDGRWEICQIGDKVEHDNPADYYNTVLKMGKKRAHVDAVLTATAASDIFTQDIEDLVDNGVMKPKQETNAEKPQTEKPQAPRRASDGMGEKERPTKEDLDKFENLLLGHLGSGQAVQDWLIEKTKDFREIRQVSQISTKKWLLKLIQKFEADQNGGQTGLFQS
ncbi:MAG TPA: hypothetical protein VLH56_11460 [Dissulfurispiraceae bacterium]|nr:hypothetical protein [Dissulfurispiraceae bacterium]